MFTEEDIENMDDTELLKHTVTHLAATIDANLNPGRDERTGKGTKFFDWSLVLFADLTGNGETGYYISMSNIPSAKEHSAKLTEAAAAVLEHTPHRQALGILSQSREGSLNVEVVAVQENPNPSEPTEN